MKNMSKKLIIVSFFAVLITCILFCVDYYDVFSKIGLNISLLNLDFWSIYSTIIGGLLGGVITLLGVIITIKDNEQKHLDNERNKFKPWLNYCIVKKDFYNNNIQIINTNFGNNFEYHINDFFLSNTDFSDFVLKALIIDENICVIESSWYIRKEATIKIFFQDYVFTDQKIKNIYVLLEDLLGNEYKVRIDFKTKYFNEFIEINGVGCSKAEYQKSSND